MAISTEPPTTTVATPAQRKGALRVFFSRLFREKKLGAAGAVIVLLFFICRGVCRFPGPPRHEGAETAGPHWRALPSNIRWGQTTWDEISSAGLSMERKSR